MNAAQYLACLLAQQACVADLRELMAQERDAMALGCFEPLRSLAQRKAQHLQQLAALDHTREAAQRAAGHAPGRAGADAAAAAFGEATQRAWGELLAAAAQARADNIQTGTVVWAHLDYTRRTINFLLNSAQLFYGKDGARRSTPLGADRRIAAG